jgi:hypothetical protein
MENREVIREMLTSKNVKVELASGEFKKRGSGARKTYVLDGFGLKSFIAENLPAIKTMFNGCSDNVLGLMGVPDETLNEYISQFSEEIEENKEIISNTKILDYFNDLVKLVFTQAKNEKERFVIFNEKENAVEKYYDIKTIQNEFFRAYGDEDTGKREFARWSSSTEKLCVHTFHQNKPKLIPVNPSLKKWEYNNYDIPQYRSIKDAQVDSQTMKLIADYFKHLIPDKDQREYFFAWIYTTLVARQETFMCLMGGQGVGKTFLMDLLAALHGISNTVRPKDPKSQFNHYLASKSMVLYDEVTLSEKDKETFKRVANRIIQIERKGEDQRDVVNSASICLASNYFYNLVVEPRDRRFSVPDLGTVQLEIALGKRRTSKLFKLLEDDVFLKWFYDWLVAKFEGTEEVSSSGIYSPTTPLKDTRSFEYCCNISAPDEIKFIIKLMNEKDADGTKRYPEITFDELIKKYKAEQKRESTSWKRITKHSIFYNTEIFIDTMKLYTLNRKQMVKVDGEKIINLLAGDNDGNGPIGSGKEENPMG